MNQNKNSPASKEENPKKNPGNPPLNKPEKNIPVKPDTDNDPTNPLPDKTPLPAVDPTRIDDPALPQPGEPNTSQEINRQQNI